MSVMVMMMTLKAEVAKVEKKCCLYVFAKNRTVNVKKSTLSLFLTQRLLLKFVQTYTKTFIRSFTLSLNSHAAAHGNMNS